MTGIAQKKLLNGYPRTAVARYGKIKILDIGGAHSKLYLKADVDAYVVDTKRGPEVRT